MEKNRKVLSDHTQTGKILRPPLIQFTHENGNPFVNVSYITEIIPEIIWHSILIERFGVRQASEFIMLLVNEMKNVMQVNAGRYAFLSNYQSLNESDYEKITTKLSGIHEFENLLNALSPFVKVFPTCKLNLLYKDKVHEYSESDVESIKVVMGKLIHKMGKEATLALANSVFVMLETGLLHVKKDSFVFKLNELKNYPDTEDSKMVASYLRASFNPIITDGELIPNHKSWVHYFWNRCYEIEPYNINELYFE